MRHINRQQAGLALITSSTEAILCTVGPAGLQASNIRCSIHDLITYAYVPYSSDQINNLEYATEVILTTPTWQLRGIGIVVTDYELQTKDIPPAVMRDVDRLGLAIVMITPHRMYVDLIGKVNQRETIDFDSGSCHISVDE